MKKTYNELRLNDLLRADPFDQKIDVVNDNGDECASIVGDRENFFEKIYSSEQHGMLKLSSGFPTERNETELVGEDIKVFIDKVTKSALNSMVLFIEGYAGCGKTTFLNYLLYKNMGTDKYNMNYYNYDIGSHYIQDKSTVIKNAIRSYYSKQLFDIIKQKDNETFQNILNQYLYLLSAYEFNQLDNSHSIMDKFINKKSFKDIVGGKFIPRWEQFDEFIFQSLKKLSLEQVIILDYVLRIAMYIETKGNNVIFICYDNMDSIENIPMITDFFGCLVSVRRKIDTYINAVFEAKRLTIRKPRFIMCTACRKITHIKVRQNERLNDNQTEDDFLKHLDISNLYSFHEIIKKRYNFFEKYFKDERKCDGNCVDKIMSELNTINSVMDIRFLEEKYSGLWNSNFRACSYVLEDVVKDYSAELNECIELKKSNVDGLDPTTLIYYGASSVMVNLICKINKNSHMWDGECLDLIMLGRVYKDPYKMTSLSRLLLTYIKNFQIVNNSPSVKITEIFSEFESMYDLNEVCAILAKMLIREKVDTWRRPICYYKNAILDNDKIISEFKKQFKNYKNKNNNYKYTELSICPSGEVFVDRISSSYELFSNRLEGCKTVYFCKNKHEIRDVLEKVYSAVEKCCINMDSFLKIYGEKLKGKGKSQDKLVTSLINPRTSGNRPQIHTERIIFSHISYLDRCRRYFYGLRESKINKFDANLLFVEYIEKYIGLYDKYIKKINPLRKEIIEKLKEKVCQNKDRDILKYIPISVEN